MDWELDDRLAVIVGHSRISPGAKAVWPLEQHEYDYNRSLSVDVIKAANKIKLNTGVFLRDGNSISQLGREVNSWCYGHNACAIELHFDAFTGEDVQGTTTLYDMDPIESMDLARMVQHKIAAVFDRSGKTDRGLRWLKMKDRGYYNLYVLEMPACIIEPGFGTNHKDAAMLKDRIPEYSMALAEVAKDFLKKERENYGKGI